MAMHTCRQVCIAHVRARDLVQYAVLVQLLVQPIRSSLVVLRDLDELVIRFQRLPILRQQVLAKVAPAASDRHVVKRRTCLVVEASSTVHQLQAFAVPA